MTNSQLFLDWHCRSLTSLTSGQAWTEVVNPRPPSLNALHNAFCLCAPAATHKNSLAPNHGRLSSLACDRAALAQLILCPPLYPQHSPLTALAAHNIDPPNCHNWTALTHTAPFAHNWKMHLIHPLRASAHAAATSKVYLLIACACSARCLSNTLLFALCAVAAATLIALHIWPSTLCRLLCNLVGPTPIKCWNARECCAVSYKCCMFVYFNSDMPWVFYEPRHCQSNVL